MPSLASLDKFNCPFLAPYRDEPWEAIDSKILLRPGIVYETLHKKSLRHPHDD